MSNDPADADQADPKRTAAGPETPFLNVGEAAEYLTVSTRTLRRYVAEGRLAYYRVGRELRFKRADLDRYLESLRREALEPRRPYSRG